MTKGVDANVKMDAPEFKSILDLMEAVDTYIPSRFEIPTSRS